MESARPDIAIIDASAERWADFETLLGPQRGGSGGCWCMLWRMSKKAHDLAGPEGRKAAMQARFKEEVSPGVLAYDGEIPVGWCSVAPRSEFPRLDSSRVLKPVDDQPVWSVTCFFIAKTHRKRGVSVALLEGAADFVRRQGGAVLEGYPVEPAKEGYPTAYAWIGFAGAFRAAGFEEVARRSPTRPIMRRVLQPSA